MKTIIFFSKFNNKKIKIMKKFSFLSVLVFALLGLSPFTNLYSQSLDVPEGPFYDSSNYIPPKPIPGFKGIMPITHMQQCNSSWGSNAYGVGSCGTICAQGCALSCGAMLLKLNSITINPGTLNTWLRNNNGYSGCAVIWSKIAACTGSSMTYAGSSAYSLSVFKTQIDAGRPVIAHVGGSNCNHFVVVYGYNGTGTASGDFLVADPGSSTFPKYWSSFTICSTETYPLRLYQNVYGSTAYTAPTNPYVKTRTSTSVTIDWTATGATSYSLFLKRSTASSYTAYSSTSKPVQFTGLNASTTYNFFVVKNCAGGVTSPPSNILTFTTLTSKESLDSIENIVANEINGYLSIDQNLVNETDVKIFPNPVDGNHELSFKGITENTNIIIYNLSGQLIKSTILTKDGMLDLPENLPSSIYIIKLQTESNASYQKLIVK